MRILAVCGMGLGSSLLLKMQVESALRELGVRVDSLEVADIATAKAISADLIVTSPQFAEMLKSGGASVVAVSNYVDKQEIRQKLAAALGVQQ